ncbi:zinc-ribbon domain-containing protein [Porcipelethomonas ammoniilytica]|uniref:zinc-ribbon domain-containing protein n=1 Tax=Porcipelethomonas ammoniilytica TaxID=2981722 RepID=UPI000821C17D|nr:zinc-ribbon domain-containing protein [Porcipelethomonas ammoniilytica]MCU6720349.1 zinc-ribbon domain-containing protein [Porcipelethomonas ammoniilytica]SCJ10005.1 DNA-directed RNA polymerase subunit P [uncultured Ruminococcus sp.]
MSNILSTVHPELVSEWSEKNLPLTPDKITYGSNKLVWWKGACGHEWQASVKARSKGENCPICSGARVVEGINDLATVKPELAAEWSKKNKDLKPTMVTVGSHKKVIWKGKCGHEWIATVKSRAIIGTGCPYCSHNAILEGFNDLASQMPEIAAEWSEKNAPLLPNQVTAFANRKVWWKCKKCGNEWHTLISTRSGGSKCPYCSGQILLKGFNDFATTHPQLAEEWSVRNLPLAPDMVNAKSRRNVWWKCRECGYEWKSVINARVKGTVCPVCADRAVLAGYNDLATTDSELLSEWDYEKNKNISPEKISRNSMQSVWWKCPLGHSWKGKISERTIEGKGCAVCEREYLTAFPKLAVMFYAGMKKLSVQTDYDEVIGIPLEIYIPEEKVAIETCNGTEKIESLKEHLCKKRNIRLLKVPYKVGNDETEFAGKIKKAFRSIHIFITSDETKDAEFIRKRFFEWRRKQNQNRRLSE